MRTVPPSVLNLTVLPKSVFATVAWGVAGDGGAPITGFRLFYRRDKSHLSPKEEKELADKPQKVLTYIINKTLKVR